VPIMGYRRSRSIESQLRRAQRHFVLAEAFYDNILHEAVNKLTPQQIADHVTLTIHELDPEAPDYLPNQVTVIQGEVLIEPRGQGSLQ